MAPLRLNRNTFPTDGQGRQVGSCWGAPFAIASVEIVTVSGSNGDFYGLTNDIDLTNYDLYVSYEVDSDSEYFEIKQLKAILRDMVACMLGSRMALENESKLRLLDIVCSTNFKPDANWIPQEYKKLKYWRKPWVSGMLLGKLNRG
jgi:hypothetical protein